MRAVAAAKDERAKTIRQRLVMTFIFLMVVAVASSAMAQSNRKRSDDKPKPRPVTLKTKDGVKLSAFYFPSDRGKDATTVLLVHEWKGQAGAYAKLVIALNKAGCAVLAPNYRGHGTSKEYTNRAGETKEFNVEQMSKRDIENIISFDLEKAKAFLKDENNDESLNLNALVVVGVGEGCVMAARWAQRDWQFQSVGRVKQGQDVKALVLISPEKQIKGVALDPALNDPNLVRLPIMIAAGKTHDEADEARRIAKRIESVKKRLGRGTADGFDLVMPNTSLGGVRLVNEQSSGVIQAIVSFVNSNIVVSDEENPWIERR